MAIMHTSLTKFIRKKLCKDCIHFDAKTENCKIFINYSLAQGTSKFVNADLMRSSVDYCGIGAQYFEAKEEHEIFRSELSNILNVNEQTDF